MGIGKWAAVSALALAGWMGSASAQAGELECKMRFTLSGWSVFYQTATGSGTVRCSNGQSMGVRIRVKGGGLTFGKSQIDDGVGKFSGVDSISEIKGHYADAGVHAGASKSAGARVMTKGNVSLALSGTGKGWDLGVAFGAFIIE
ncbi:hypothetical protein SAMN04487785_107149 [Dyella jiangningensis]|uniref:hypothetical protein n=1 Tax=Dyella sp. AtDHG13 TaxID=1938897 RepID=UPI00088CA335|nr:hypothetical protein [Dyella sp. AtDHG13]PXV57334.1 hypothetical protein BDW41_107163 [Dyella sp. AtDHG13]SDK40459.1 hypothetical protein SAMN04487785_107149 [Dyella jiangningensis]